jgi:hypothetical protein
MLVVPAQADDGQSVKMPRIMMESGEVTSVVDAFDGDDPFDANISLGFQYSAKSARILRETSIYQPGLTTGGFTSNRMHVADYSEATSRLIPQVELGIYHDLSFVARLPIILSNTRSLSWPSSVAEADQPAHLGTALAGAPNETLFNLPFESPDRSGIEYLALGLNVDIFNEARDFTKPTWLLGAEVRLSVGEPMHPCTTNPGPGEVECADSSDVNRNGRTDRDLVGADNVQLEGNDIDERSPGITRGTVGLELHTVMSKRVKYIEPYGGLSALFEFQQGESEYGMTDAEGALVNHPPLVGTVMLGMMFIPWEDREDFGRLTFDVRFTGDYISEGRDYSELFDALGSSSASSLRKPEWARYRDACPGGTCDPKSVVDLASQKTYFTGLSVVEAHGSYRGSGSVTWQANEYFKINAGIGFRFEQAHGISHDGPCNPDMQDSVGESGPCHSSRADGRISSTGIPNPAYRPTINAVGRRFFVDESWTFDFSTTAVVMF